MNEEKSYKNKDNNDPFDLETFDINELANELEAEERRERTPRKRKKVNPIVEFWQLYAKYILILLAIIIVVVVAVIVGGRLKKKPTSAPTAETQSTTSAAELDATTLPLEKDCYPEVNALVTAYFYAAITSDVDSMENLLASTESISKEQLDAEREFVEGYQNISCYTVQGPLEGSYVTYVEYDMKFIGVNTPAPCLIRLFICPRDNGELYIYNTDMDENIAAYIEQVDAREDVKALATEVDNKLTEAMVNDEALSVLVTRLRGEDGDVTITESESQTQETQAEVVESETAETEAPTEAPAESQEVTDPSAFIDVDEVVYARENVNVRRSPDANAEIAGTLTGGSEVRRTGYNDGWSRIEFNGEICYVAAGYLTENAPTDGSGFVEVDEVVYAKESVRVRSSADPNSEIVGTLLEGESIRRTGYNDDFSRVIYEGETCYIGAGYLTTLDPSEQ